MDAIKQSSGSIIFLKSFLLAMILVMMSSFTSVQAADEKIGAGSNNNGFAYKQIGVQNPSTDLWRAIRQRVPEGSNNSSSANQAKSMGLDSSSSTSLINTQGQEWRNFRMNKFIPLSMLLLAGVFLVLLLFRLIRGKIKIKSGRSGKKILRFSGMQRFVHWTVAILFVILAITGTLLTFGRIGLVPLIGSSAFGSIAGFGKLLHDYLGPVFGIMLVIMLFTFIKGNFGNMTDIKWFLKGGGIFGKHASAGRYNAGEKLWFWIAILAGAVVVISGVILDFPFFDQTRGDIELSHRVHAIGAIGLLAVSFGHIFMGTVAMEGAYESMRTGYCDENWAKEHHDLWHADLQKQGVLGSAVTKYSVVESDTIAAVAAAKKVVSIDQEVRESSVENTSEDKNKSVKPTGTTQQKVEAIKPQSAPIKESTQSPSIKAVKEKIVKEKVATKSKAKIKNKAVKKAGSKPKATKTTGAAGKPDDLKKVEGIGPKIEGLLHAAGITSFALLSVSKFEALNAILDDAGPRYRMHNPKTWPQQAVLADKGAWDELSELQDRLSGGRE